MAREIQQIMQELETAYAPQRQAVQERMNQLPGFYEAQRGGVETARTNAYQDITRQANARGMVYSGAPIQEQQRYTGERYLPALAQLSGQEGEQRFGLQQALNQLGERQLTYAQQIRTKEQELDEARRQFDAQLAAQREAEARAAKAAARAGAGGISLGGLGGGGQKAGPAPSVRQVYDQSVQQLEGLLKGRNAPSYEQAVDTMVSKFGGQGISPQEIGSYLYNLYSRYFNTSQTKQYFGQGGSQAQRDNIVNYYKQNVAGRR
jgi:hypothetical protein